LEKSKLIVIELWIIEVAGCGLRVVPSYFPENKKKLVNEALTIFFLD
jgi:hypothetical protein